MIDIYSFLLGGVVAVMISALMWSRHISAHYVSKPSLPPKQKAVVIPLPNVAPSGQVSIKLTVDAADAEAFAQALEDNADEIKAAIEEITRPGPAANEPGVPFPSHGDVWAENCEPGRYHWYCNVEHKWIGPLVMLEDALARRYP